MSEEVGLTLDERIRRELPPLCGPLRIDAFLTTMTRERSRASAAKARAARGPEPPIRKTAPVEPAPSEGESPLESALASPESAGSDLADSKKIRAEVDAFLHRDDRRDATENDVADYLDYMGPAGFNPDELPE